jgi:putative transposase
MPHGLSRRQVLKALSASRATFYRSLHPEPPGKQKPRRAPERALTEVERAQVLKVLHEPRFVDKSPAEVYATLLDEGVYLCSERTMYRVLKAAGESSERRRQRVHPVYQKPELLAVAPRQVWTWDITKLKGPVKGQFFCLYVILDLFSRYVVGWMIADGESAALAKKLIDETCMKQGIEPDQLTLHADRGSAMTSKGVAQLLADLGVTRTHSRPHTSDDNPFSESQFKTLKYHPEFPARFGSLEDARNFCRYFFNWYNCEHRHSGIAMFTPHAVHHGLAKELLEQRERTLIAAYQAHPERFVRRAPEPRPLPQAVWINPPPPTATTSSGSLSQCQEVLQ